jgi:hypothetical protein
MVDVCAYVTVEDLCDPEPSWVLYSYESNEPDNDRSDGNTIGDIEAHTTTQDPCHLSLRSERQGLGEGRKYTLIYRAADHSGNLAYDTVCVTVPHNQSAAAMSATGFTATGTAFENGTRSFAVVIPGTEAIDVKALDLDRVYLGNTAGVLSPRATQVVDVNKDGRQDLAMTYEYDAAFGATGLFKLYTEKTNFNKNSDGPVGVHFVTPDGTDYLVSNILALGEPVDVPGAIVKVAPAAAAPIVPSPASAKVTELSSVHPNPFNPQTTVSYSLAADARVRVAIYDVRGAMVRLLVDDSQSAGSHHAVWDGVDDSGRPMGSGIYFVRMTAGSVQETRKIVMLK